jgi:flagellar motor switch protein FliN
VPETQIPESEQWLVQEWARQLTNVLESMIGEAPDITFGPSLDAAAAQSELLWWEQPFSLGAEFILWAGAPEASWQQIGRSVLSGAGVEDGDAESIRSTYMEIVQQAVAGVAGVLSGKAGKEVSCLQGEHTPPPADVEGSRYSFEIHFGEAEFPVLAVFTFPLSGLSETHQDNFPEPAKQNPAKSAAAEPAKPNSIDLLLDVELPVSVSFGRAQLPLKDVIKLTTGSIVELNRAVTEPVDVIVNNCVIARGEVVVVEGNFGIRIKQVVSRQERLRTLY